MRNTLYISAFLFASLCGTAEAAEWVYKQKGDPFDGPSQPIRKQAEPNERRMAWMPDFPPSLIVTKVNGQVRILIARMDRSFCGEGRLRYIFDDEPPREASWKDINEGSPESVHLDRLTPLLPAFKLNGSLATLVLRFALQSAISANG